MHRWAACLFLFSIPLGFPVVLLLVHNAYIIPARLLQTMPSAPLSTCQRRQALIKQNCALLRIFRSADTQVDGQKVPLSLSRP